MLLSSCCSIVAIALPTGSPDMQQKDVEESDEDDAFYKVKEVCLISPHFDDILTIEFTGGSEYGTGKEMRIEKSLCDSGL